MCKFEKEKNLARHFLQVKTGQIQLNQTASFLVKFDCHGALPMRSMITTLLDPARYPALDLACAYHEPWEIELVIDEIDTH